MNDLDAHIQHAFQAAPLDDVERDEVWRDARTRRTNHVPPRRRRSGWVPTRTLLLAGIVVVGVSSVALAAGSDIVQRVFGDNDPAVTRVDQFAQPTHKVTRAEYKEIAGMRMVPGVKRIGIIKDSEMVEKFPVAPYEDARVLVDDPRLGRIIGLASVDGKTLCTITTRAPSEAGFAGSGTCGAFDHAGLMADFSFGNGKDSAAFTFSGVAADDVSAITLTFADGSTDDVPLIDNGFLWSGRGEDQRPTRISTTRGGRDYTSENLFARENDPTLIVARHPGGHRLER